jgi:hypothetical protein
MSQEDALSTATLLPEDPTPVDPEALVTTYADSLITDLFDDVDKILDGDEAALAAAERETPATSTAIAPIVDTAAQTLEDSTTIAAPLGHLGGEIDFFRPEDLPASTAPAPAKSRFGRLFDRLLLSVAALSLLGIGGLLWFDQRSDRLGSTATDPSQQQADEEFLTYLQRSLEVIYGKQAQGKLSNSGAVAQVPVGTAMPTPPMLPPLGAGGTVGSLGTGPINVIERVYIPYQTGQQQPASLPPTVVQQQAVAPGAAGTPPMPAQPAAAAAIHGLVGVLELGDRSAALFEINGVAQRVYIGERIGSSGWSLVSVSNEEAVIRRNGEVRSIFIGQRF